MSNLSRPLPAGFKQLIADMKATVQFENISVLKHGFQVNKAYRNLIACLKSNNPKDTVLPIPEPIFEIFNLKKDQLVSEAVLRKYQILHDCGKPYCLSIDEHGRRHYPDHANVSSVLLRSLGFDDLVCELVSKDMLIHSGSMPEIRASFDDPLFLSLLLTSIAELHANSTMFGGLSSTSFKIKYKKLCRVSSLYLQHLNQKT